MTTKYFLHEFEAWTFNACSLIIIFVEDLFWLILFRILVSMLRSCGFKVAYLCSVILFACSIHFVASLKQAGGYIQLAITWPLLITTVLIKLAFRALLLNLAAEIKLKPTCRTHVRHSVTMIVNPVARITPPPSAASSLCFYPWIW